MFALVDCNTFYASCEAIFNPAVRGRPVAVLSNNDGCIISLNREARALADIPAFSPYHEARAVLQKHDVQVFSSNYELYGDISARVMRLLETLSLDMEVYSIDEAFLRLRHQDLQEQGKVIRERLWRDVRMPVCVGIAPTKTLAKLANHAAKKISRLNGVCVLDTQEKREWLLARLPVDAVWGIGGRLARKLAALNIHTALELSQADPKWLRRRFSVTLEMTLRELRGEPCLDLELMPAPRRNIISTRSFSYRITQLQELQEAITLYATRACEKMRRQHSTTRQLWVYAESGSRNEAHFYRQRFVTLPFDTDDTRMIASAARETLAQIYRQGIRFKKCGIGLLELQPRRYQQQDFWSERQSERSQQLMQLMDRINQRYGRQHIHLAGTGIEPAWTMRRAHKSPAYTTRWADIPNVRC